MARPDELYRLPRDGRSLAPGEPPPSGRRPPANATALARDLSELALRLGELARRIAELEEPRDLHRPLRRTRLLDATEAARRLGITKSSLYARVRCGEIPAVRIGERCLRFDPQALDDWVCSGGTERGPE